MKEKVETLYHYCSVETFFSIIKNASLWLSDIEKSNDYEECVVCRELVNKKMEEYLRIDLPALEIWKKWYQNGTNSHILSRTFGACFSESMDQLSQWRGYAQNGKGIAIGFDKELLAELNAINKYFIAFGKVKYNHTENYVDRIVNDNIKKLEYKSVAHVALELSQNYELKFPFIKNPGFEEEKEWRAVVCYQIGNYNVPCSDKITFSKVKYRASEYNLIPYIEMNFEKIKQNLIKEIWLGPKSELEIRDVVSFLYYCGYYEGIEEGFNSAKPIWIRKSSTSYR